MYPPRLDELKGWALLENLSAPVSRISHAQGSRSQLWEITPSHRVVVGAVYVYAMSTTLPHN